MSFETVSEFGAWTAEGHPLSVEYSLTALDDIRVAVVDGLHCLSRGGIEVGGVLFGQHGENVVRILAERPITSGYFKGPCFVLSGEDLAALEQLLAAARSDESLRGLEPVGWYHSHTRTGILLDDADIGVFDRYFPLPWQVALVLHPEKFGPVTAGFFFREAHGHVRTKSSYREFLVPPAPSRRREPTAPPPASSSVPPTPSREVTREERQSAGTLGGAPLPPRPPRPSTPPVKVLAGSRGAGTAGDRDARLGEFLAKVRPHRARRRKWFIALALSIVAALAGLAVRTYLFPPGKDTLALHGWDSQGQLRIEWDHAARPVRNAERGILEILDAGAKTEIRLDREQLRLGSLTYARQSGDVTLRLTLLRNGSAPFLAVTRFLGPPPAPQQDVPLPKRE